MLLLAFFMTFSLLQFLSKKCYQSGHQRAPWLLSSRVMSIFAITSHQYTITLYTPGHLQISWDVFAKKSADILSFRNSFITISTWKATLLKAVIYYVRVHGTSVAIRIQSMLLLISIQYVLNFQKILCSVILYC